MRAILHGTDEIDFIALAAALGDAGFTLAEATPASVFISFSANADGAIANAHKFADAVPFGQEALVVNILHAHTPDDWHAARTASLLWAFTRHAAVNWAPRRLRVNAVGRGVSPTLPDQSPCASGQAACPAPAAPATLADVAATILAMWEFPSMTGQLIRLGAP